MGHIYAALAVLPKMVARGGGYLLNTVSTAGFLSSIGDATYSATLRAAFRGASNRCIEEASVAPAKCRSVELIERILAHLKNKAPSVAAPSEAPWAFYWLEGRNRAEIEEMQGGVDSTEVVLKFPGFCREGPRQRRLDKCRHQ